MLDEARPVGVGRTPDHPIRVAATPQQLQRLRRCVAGRRPVLLAMHAARAAGRSLADPAVKQAAYRHVETRAVHGAPPPGLWLCTGIPLLGILS